MDRRRIDGLAKVFEDFFGPGSSHGQNEEIHWWSRPDTIWQYLDFDDTDDADDTDESSAS